MHVIREIAAMGKRVCQVIVNSTLMASPMPSSKTQYSDWLADGQLRV